jgi:SPP1 family predicted phage head-tail adaptor
VIDIGRYTERVTILAPTETRSFSGESTFSWETELGTFWAQVDGLSSRDILQAQQANVIATHRIRIRYRAGITHLHRVVWNGRTMELASVTERGNRTYLEMLAREVQ